MTGRQPLWRWGQVAKWLAAHNIIDRELADNASVIESINLALEIRAPKKCDEVMALVQALNENLAVYA